MKSTIYDSTSPTAFKCLCSSPFEVHYLNIDNLQIWPRKLNMENPIVARQSSPSAQGARSIDTGRTIDFGHSGRTSDAVLTSHSRCCRMRLSSWSFSLPNFESCLILPHALSYKLPWLFVKFRTLQINFLHNFWMLNCALFSPAILCTCLVDL